LTNSGYLALAITVTNFFYSFAAYNNRGFQVSDVKQEYNDSEYVAARIVTCIVSVLLCVVFVFGIGFTAIQIKIILCYMLFRAGEAFIDVLHGIDQKSWRMDYIGVSLVVRGILMLASFIILGWFFELLPAIIGMTVITFIICLLYDLPKTKKLVRYGAYSGKQIFSLLKRCFPLMLVILISTIIVSYTRFSIERIYGVEALGVYSPVTAPTLIVQISVSLLFAPLANLFADSLKTVNKKRFVQIFAVATAIIAGITFVVALGTYFLGEWGLNILYRNPEITFYAYLLPGAAVVAGLTGSLWYMNLVFSVVRDIKGLFFCNLAGVIICFITVDMFLNRYGLAGANHAMITSQGIVVLCLFIRLFWVINKKQGLFTTQRLASES